MIDRKEMEKRQRRGFILEAAERVFGQKPFDEATMQEVAAQAQIGMQGLYEHFPSKQALYESLILSRIDEVKDILTKRLEPIGDPIEALKEWAVIYVERFGSAPAFLPVFLREKIHFDWGISSRFGPIINKAFKREEKRLAKLITRAIESGILEAHPVFYLRDLFTGCVGASLRYHIVGEPGEEVEQCVQRAMDCFMSGAGA